MCFSFIAYVEFLIFHMSVELWLPQMQLIYSEIANRSSDQRGVRASTILPTYAQPRHNQIALETQRDAGT